MSTSMKCKLILSRLQLKLGQRGQRGKATCGAQGKSSLILWVNSLTPKSD